MRNEPKNAQKQTKKKKGERPIDVISLLDALLAPHHRLVLTKTHARILCTTLRQSFLTLTTTADWGIIWRYLYTLSLVKYHCLIIKDVLCRIGPTFSFPLSGQIHTHFYTSVAPGFPILVPYLLLVLRCQLGLSLSQYSLHAQKEKRSTSFSFPSRSKGAFISTNFGEESRERRPSQQFAKGGGNSS